MQKVKLAPMSVGNAYNPTLDPRWQQRIKEFGKINYFNIYDLSVHNQLFPMVLGANPKPIFVKGVHLMAHITEAAREVIIDGRVCTRIGAPNGGNIFVGGTQGSVSVQGQCKKLWIDGVEHEFRLDQAYRVTLGLILLDTVKMSVLIDGTPVCPLTMGKPQIFFKSRFHWIQFYPPERKFCLGETTFLINFCRKFPCITDDKGSRGIKFQGPPRAMIINGKSYKIGMNEPTKINLNHDKPYLISFGGPYHEVIINEQWFHVPFDGKIVVIVIEGNVLEVMLSGPVPTIEVLGYIDQTILSG